MRKFLFVISAIIIVALLAVLGYFGYVIYDSVSNFGSFDKDFEQTYVAESGEETTAPEEIIITTDLAMTEIAVETTVAVAETVVETTVQTVAEVTVPEEVTVAVETQAVTTAQKPKPAKTTAATTKAKPAATTAATTKATAATTTAAPKPAEPEMYTETSVVGSDKVVKYYNIEKDGSKTLSNTITYRNINGKEVVLTNIDEIRGYGRQNEYDASGNLLRYLTYNVKYGKRTLEILYDASGKVVKRVTYEYNGEGKKIKESTYDSADNLMSYITYEYIVSGKTTKTKVVTHDANGKVTSTVVR